MGATERRAVSDQFDGDRRGTLVDPFGHVWILATRLENVAFTDIRQRFDKVMGLD
jgi:PhnB protein